MRTANRAAAYTRGYGRVFSTMRGWSFRDTQIAVTRGTLTSNSRRIFGVKVGHEATVASVRAWKR